jgi:hypothetical protein
MVAEALSTVDALIDALGGTTAVADFLRVVPSAVSNARRDRRLPERWRYKLSRWSVERGLIVDPAVFEDPPAALSPPPARRKREGAAA